MIKCHKEFFIFLAIIAIAIFLRFWQLGAVPASPDWDEAALGYNAYSLLKTGRDEYGTWFPLTIRSYDDYKPPLYVYLVIPSIALFGLDTWSVRVPSASLGVLAVVGTYILVYELEGYWAGEKKKKSGEFIRSPIALLSAFLLAISPWHIQFSRIAFEANIGVTINIWALVAFFKALKRPSWLPVSAFFFGLALYAYHSERIFAPLLVLLLVLTFWKTLFANRTHVFIAMLVGLLTVAPLVPIILAPTTAMRLRGTSSLADETGLLARSVSEIEVDISHGDVIGVMIHNRRIVWMRTIVEGYLSHYSFKWLFLAGDNPRHHAPDMGMLYLWELPFLLVGIYQIGKAKSQLRTFLFGWLIIAPIAASPTTELPHAIRTLVFLPSFQIVTAFGMYASFLWLRRNKKAIQYSITIPILIFILFNIFYYFHMYFVHMNLEYSKFWQYGYKEAVAYASAHHDAYKKIVVSTKLEQPHMFFLFFLRYNPVLYLQEGGTKSGGFAEAHNAFDIYEFRPINWPTEVRDGSILYIGAPSEIPVGIKTISYMSGLPAIRIADR